MIHYGCKETVHLFGFIFEPFSESPCEICNILILEPQAATAN